MDFNFTIPQLVYTLLLLPPLFSLIAAVNILGKGLLHWLNRLTAVGAGAIVVEIVRQFDSSNPVAFGYL